MPENINIHQRKLNTRRQLQLRNLKDRLYYLYMLSLNKITNSLVPIIDERLLPEKLHSNTGLSTNAGYRISKDRAKFSLCNLSAKAFNELPDHIQKCTSLVHFKPDIKHQILKPIQSLPIRTINLNQSQ